MNWLVKITLYCIYRIPCNIKQDSKTKYDSNSYNSITLLQVVIRPHDTQNLGPEQIKEI
jgi:hypothetical protein